MPVSQTDDELDREPRAQDTPTDMPKAGWVDILKRSLQQFKHDDITDRAAALTYFGVLALFPAVLVLVSVLGLLGRSTTQDVLNNVGELAPGAVKSFLSTVINQVQGKAGAAGAAAIVGLLVALWSASGYVAAFMRASNAIYEVDEGRPIWKTAPVRLLTTLVLVVLLLLALIMVMVTGPVADQVGKAFGIGSTATLLWDIVKWPVLLVVVSVIFSILYKATPNVKQPRFRWITPGGVLAVVVGVLASALFAVYVAFSGSYNKTYGTLATVIVFLVWLWITNIAILIGAEFNAETQRERAIRAGMPADLEPFAPLRDTRKLDDEQREQAERAAAVRRRTIGADEPDAQVSDAVPTPRSTQVKEPPTMTDTPHPAPGSTATTEPTLGELVGRMSEQTSRLVRDELRLAQAEMAEKGKRAGLGAGLFGGAGVFAGYGLGVLVAAAVLGLAQGVDAWLAALIVAAVLFAVAGVSAVVGKKEISQATPPVPAEAVAGVKQDVQALKPGSSS